MRHNIRGFVASVAGNLDLPEPIVEIGAYQVESQEGFADLRPLLPGKTYIGCDMRPGTGVDRIEDVEAGLSFADGSVGTLICVDTLEHVFDVQTAFREFRRVLKPGGALVVASIMFFPIHGYPYDYWRFTPECFSRLLEPFDHYHVFSEGEPDFPHTVYGLATLDPKPAAYDVAAARTMEYVRNRPPDWSGLVWRPSIPLPGQADATSAELAQVRAALTRLEPQMAGLTGHVVGVAQRQAEQLDQLAATVAALDGQTALLDLREQLRLRERELQRLTAERGEQALQIQALAAERARLQARLDRILGSRPLRLYSRLQAIPGLRRLARRLLGVRSAAGS